MKISQILIVVLFFTSFSAVLAQNKLSGKIIDENKLPVESINVIIKNSENKTVEGTLTDSLGNFSVELEKQTYLLQIVQFDELYYQKQIVFIDNVDLGNIKITNTKSLKEISVVSKQPQLKKELGKYFIENISNSKFSKGKNTFELLNYIPILNVTENGISIFNKGNATFFINGKPIGDNEIALNMIKSIPVSSIKKIEIIANPDSKYNSNSKNGIINIILKNNENEGLKGSVNSVIRQSYFNSQNVNGFLSYSKKKINTTAGINLDSNNHFTEYTYLYNNLLSNQQTKIASNTVNKTKNYSFYNNFDFNLSSKNVLGLQLNYKLFNKKSITETNNTFKNIDSDINTLTSLNNIYRKTPNNNSFRGNINFTHKLDTIGSNIYISNTQFFKTNNNKNEFDFINSNATYENFIQNQDEKFNINESNIDIYKIINGDNKLYFGGNFAYSNIENNFFHGIFDGYGYISDPLQTNSFSYIDKVISGYVSYEKIINDKWESKIGIRIENFKAKGKTPQNSNQLNISNTYFLPSLAFLFIPNENNELSFDLSSYITRPSYIQVNPFIKYNSSNSYTINNPNLLPTLTHEVTLEYSYKNNFIVNLSYAYDKNLFNEFDIVLPDNTIQITTSNYGNGNDLNLNLVYTNNFYNKNWTLAASFYLNYSDTKGGYNNVDLSFSNTSYSFRLKNQINLSKNKNFNIGIIYKYSAADKWISGNLTNFQSLFIDLNKSYKNFNFSFEAFDLALSSMKFDENKTSYNFYKKINYFKTFSLSVRYNFGNKKVKKIDEKKSEINKRLL